MAITKIDDMTLVEKTEETVENTTVYNKADLEARKASLQAQIDDIDTKLNLFNE